MDIVDTHQHLWEPARLSYSWCAGIPALNRAFGPDEYQRAIADLPGAARIVQSVHVEADVDEVLMQDESRWIASIADDPARPTVAFVAPCRPEHDGFEAYLDAIAHPRLRGVRRVLHTQPDDLSRSDLFARHLRLLPARKLSFDLCVLARQLPLAADLIRRCPGTAFILDHCGVPDIKGGGLDPWREHLRQVAALPNVVACKISGLVVYADHQRWTIEDLRPYVEHALDCFGFDRVVFGGDWPVCTLAAPLSRWIGTLQQLLAQASADERARLLAGNARRVYRLDPQDKVPTRA